MAVPHRRSLIRVHAPRRSLYIPICAKLGFAIKMILSSALLLERTLDIALG